MKSFVAAAVVACSVIQSASAHYIWQSVNGGAAYQYFRTNTNYNSPVTDTTSTDLRCNVGASASGGSTGTLAVAAGATLTLGLDTAVYHQGPVMFYLGKVPSGSASSWDGSGVNWFKFQQFGPTFSGGSSTWPMSISYSVKLPSSLPAGQWLLRAEQIGIHNPAGAPQFYVGCAQLSVTGGGSCSPSYFAIPGHIKSTDPGITANIYSNFNSYSMPGPAVYNCDGGNNPPPPPPPTSTRAPSTLATTVRPASTSTRPAPTSTPPASTTRPSGATQTLYGQCGGSSYTGPTVCATGTCKATNQFYSQCLP